MQIKFYQSLLVAIVLAVAIPAIAQTTLRIATVSNPDMERMQGLSDAFTSDNPGIKLEWIVLDENTLRQRVTTDIATRSGRFDIVTIGIYEAPTWAICLVFGYGLNFINIMPFVYLFLPTWAVSIIVYTVLARRSGAYRNYPEAEKREQEFARKVAEYHAQLAVEESVKKPKDTSVLSRAIRAVWIVIGLLVPAVLAWRVLFHSPDLYEYYVNREMFYNLTIWCTLIYFVFAWWDLQRSKKLQQS